MSDATLTVAVIYGVLVTILYAYVGRSVGGRQVSPQARLAQQLFVIWWYGLAASSLIGAVQTILYINGRLSVVMFSVLGQLVLLLIIVALWGLLYYLVYLYTGSRRSIIPLSIFYVAFYVVLLAMSLTNPVERLVDDGWSITGEPALEFSRIAGILLTLVLIGPQIGAGLAYFRLYFKVDDRTQKYRIALVSWSIIVWFGLATLGSLAQLSDVTAWQWISRFLGLAAALTILAAYRPPGWVQRKYGIKALNQGG